ncbi:uncharacterized protein F5Z01DRAFT_697815 [Emericellopsis atlantica]|uniref:Uncharacterized protein n=1 Tax=Emericellopsis atlantica TaxID=2614577 RepID=A0A9P7ZD13_9HYPO|nr:uncharacterized protein F5Z01DRAFT_697815 [Emericellopsis atlantica]KAG9249501.1 hypothetical protein F5Z01DRAFT_697815 [Emericellopsis atlantica]
MPKRAAPATDAGARKSSAPDTSGVKKAERSHEGNQERAYVAASRRQDRSIEARVQSARMASEIHKKRTGKGLRVTEEIVRREEMYKEEEDDLPRSLRMLDPQMQTSSPEFNARIEAWMTKKMAMSQFMQRSNDAWAENPINRLFAQSFPDAGVHAQHITRQLSLGNTQQQQQQQHQQQNVQSPGPQSPHPQNLQSPMSPAFNQQPFLSVPTHNHERHGSVMSAVSPTNADTKFSPTLTHDASSPATPATLAPQPQYAGNDSQSIFTADLPPEMRLLMGMPNMEPNPHSQNIYAQNWQSMRNGFYDGMSAPQKLGEYDQPPADNMFADAMAEDANWQYRTEEPAWDSFLNDNVWSSQE